MSMNFIDTSPFYGRGMSEVMLGIALKGVPRDSYILGTKLGRYSGTHFDFSARRVCESVDVSLERMGVEHLDIILCHDLEFVDMQQIVDETLPALRKMQQQGKVGYVGISGYPMKAFRFVADRVAAGLHPLLQSLHAAEHHAGRPGALPEAKGHRNHERRAIQCPPADQCSPSQVA